MKVHNLTHGIRNHHEPDAFLSLGCKLTTSSNDPNISPLNRKSFIQAEDSPRRIQEGNESNPHLQDPQVEMHTGGTRWNPTQEQIGILETLYGGGVRTPNAQQIEQITAQLGEYGKIEGKNVFYWFQNHKARERQKQKQKQKQKRSSFAYIHFPPTSSSISVVSCGGREDHIDGEADTPCKRKSMSLGAEFSRVSGGDGKTNSSSGEDDRSSVVLKTLDLFPLRPEGKS